MHYTISFLLLISSFAYAQEVLWVRSGETTNAHFGGLIFPLGDQNDDGFDDWAVFSQGEFAGPDDEERFDFFYGGSPPQQTPYLSFHSYFVPEVEFMFNINTISDFNGDGYVDWVIGYQLTGNDSAQINFFGGGSEADTIPEAILHVPMEPVTDIVGSLGDHNGDGRADVFYYDASLDQAYFFLGSLDWDMTVDFTNRGEPIGSSSQNPENLFGDFNGDGFDDYMTGTAPPNEHTYIFFGSATPDTIPDIDWVGNFDFPATLSADMNGDGAADLAVSRDPRTIDVHLGGDDLSPIPLFSLAYQGCNNVAHEIASAGDYNRDGFEDLVVVNGPCDNGFGRLSLWLGGFWLNPDAVLEIQGLSAPPFNDVQLFRAVGIGDINDDGIDDLAIGCQGSVLNSRRGKVVILSGDTTLVVPVSDQAPVVQEMSLSAFPNPFNSTTTLRLNLPIGTRNVTLTVSNILGQQVEHRKIEVLTPQVEIQRSADNWPSGIYLARAEALNNSQTTKLVLLK